MSQGAFATMPCCGRCWRAWWSRMLGFEFMWPTRGGGVKKHPKWILKDPVLLTVCSEVFSGGIWIYHEYNGMIQNHNQKANNYGGHGTKSWMLFSWSLNLMRLMKISCFCLGRNQQLTCFFCSCTCPLWWNLALTTFWLVVHPIFLKLLVNFSKQLGYP